MTGTSMAEMVNLAKGLKQSATQAAEDTAAFLKFSKFGAWVWGTEDTEVEPDSQWVIHPQSFCHGWIAWGDKAHRNEGEKLGDVSVPAFQPLPPKMDLDVVQGSWAHQVSMNLLCIEGFDADVRVVFNTNSLGGRKVYQKIVDAVVNRITAGEAACCPVVEMETDFYKHKTYGQIFTPIMKIVSWKTLAELDAAGPSSIEDKSDADIDAEAEAELEADSAAIAAEQEALVAAEKAAAELEAKLSLAKAKKAGAAENKERKTRKTRKTAAQGEVSDKAPAEGEKSLNKEPEAEPRRRARRSRS